MLRHRCDAVSQRCAWPQVDLVAVLDSTLSPLFPGLLKNLYKSCLDSIACQQFFSGDSRSRSRGNQQTRDLNFGISWDNEPSDPTRRLLDHEAEQQYSSVKHLDWFAYGTQMFGVVRSGHLTSRMKRTANVEFTTLDTSMYFSR